MKPPPVVDEIDDAPEAYRYIFTHLGTAIVGREVYFAIRQEDYKLYVSVLLGIGTFNYRFLWDGHRWVVTK